MIEHVITCERLTAELTRALGIPRRLLTPDQCNYSSAKQDAAAHWKARAMMKMRTNPPRGPMQINRPTWRKRHLIKRLRPITAEARTVCGRTVDIDEIEPATFGPNTPTLCKICKAYGPKR